MREMANAQHIALRRLRPEVDSTDSTDSTDTSLDASALRVGRWRAPPPNKSTSERQR